jgi:hypothetical protein
MAFQDELNDGTGIYKDLSANISYSGIEQLSQMEKLESAAIDTQTAMENLTKTTRTLMDFAESLTNPQAPNVTVMIGNKEFKGYIVKTATDGIQQKTVNYLKGVGA